MEGSNPQCASRVMFQVAGLLASVNVAGLWPHVPQRTWIRRTVILDLMHSHCTVTLLLICLLSPRTDCRRQQVARRQLVQ